MSEQAIDLKFSSGNSTPVERAVVTAEEWRAVKQELQMLRRTSLPVLLAVPEGSDIDACPLDHIIDTAITIGDDAQELEDFRRVFAKGVRAAESKLSYLEFLKATANASQVEAAKADITKHIQACAAAGFVVRLEFVSDGQAGEA